MKSFRDLKFIVILLLLAVGLTACDRQGPAETAGENIDQAVDKAGDKIDDAADKVEDSMTDKDK
jgi:predicted small lipoprotein YifL